MLKHKKLINNLESIQKSFTYYSLGLYDTPYEDRLKIADLPQVRHRLIANDLIATKNYFNGSLYLNFVPFTHNSNSTRSQLSKHRCETSLFANYWSNRIFNKYSNIDKELLKDRKKLLKHIALTEE